MSYLEKEVVKMVKDKECNDVIVEACYSFLLLSPKDEEEVKAETLKTITKYRPELGKSIAEKIFRAFIAQN